jgi:galactose mutarotase-like enzyme
MQTRIARGRMTASIDSMGAQLSSLTLDGHEYLWQADPTVWGKHAPVLFPIVGSLRGDTAASAAGTCTMPRHGLARINEHTVKTSSPDSVTFCFESTDETLAAYPYPFRLEMTYTVIEDDCLEQRFSVTNTGTETMPFSVGGHPAFNVPMPGSDASFADYELAFEEPWSCSTPVIADGGLLDYDHTTTLFTEKDTLPVTHELFANDAIVLEDVPERTVTLRDTTCDRGVRVEFPGFDYIGIWSAAGDAPFVALEPWSGTATRTDEDDVMEHKQDVTMLEPGATDVRAFAITLL